MFVAYVWPFRKLPKSQERKTFFWLECNYEEAIGVLHEAKLSIEDFKNYIELLHRYRKDNHASRDFGEGLSVYSRIGFLVSEDGRTVEWASPGFPISNQWNAYNPFKEVSAQHIDRLSKITSILNSHAVQVLLNSELPNSQLMPPTRICGSGLAASTSDSSDWAILPTDGLSQE
jgi:hypothetical protein